MSKKIILSIYFILITMVFGNFKEIVPFESQIFSIEVEEEKKVDDIKTKKKDVQKKVTIDSVQVVDKEVVKKIIEENSIPVITEKQLENIIANSKSSPSPENTQDMERLDYYFFNFKKEKKDDFFEEIEKTLKKYNFSDKSEDSFGGKITTKEITSDWFIDNLELGVGVVYENTECYDSDKIGQNSDMWSHTPVYATGKYSISRDESSNKYLKVNLGYAIGEYENSREYDEIKNQSGVYYGVGGGVEYSDTISLDLMYQVNKDAYERDNRTQDDSRVTFSVDYKFFN